MAIGIETAKALAARAKAEDAVFIRAIKRRARYNEGTKTWYPTRSQVIEAFWETSPEIRGPLEASGELEDATEHLIENLIPSLQESLDELDIDVQEDDY